MATVKKKSRGRVSGCENLKSQQGFDLRNALLASTAYPALNRLQAGAYSIGRQA